MLRRMALGIASVAWLTAVTVLSLAAPGRAQAQCGADIYGSNSNIGGNGYNALVLPFNAQFRVDTRAELVSALSQARSGQIIYVEEHARIDLIPPGLPVSQWVLTIPGGVTLASGRGHNGGIGGLLYIDPEDTSGFAEDIAVNGVLRVNQPGVRITGIRLTGNDTSVGGPNAYAPPVNAGVLVHEAGTLELDNNELWGWTLAAVSVEDAQLHVHHNHIHQNVRAGLGYGVLVVRGAFARIESNIFDHNRHDIAGSGEPNQSYEARYNLIIGQGTSHAFDMHGEGERAGIPSGYAGARVVIEYNTFVDDGADAVRFRGAPYVFGYVDANQFTHAAAAHDAITQELFNCEVTNLNCGKKVAPGMGQLGTYDPANPGPMPSPTTDGFHRVRQLSNCAGVVGWYRFDTGYGGWYPLATSGYGIGSLAFGRFNNDQVADVFRADGNGFFISNRGIGGWTRISTHPQTLPTLRFGNFVGDFRTDVFRTSGGSWLVSDAGSGDWTTLNTSGYGVSQLAFGNFVGDSRTDVFRASGSAWFVSASGSASWQQINTSTYTLSELAFGDFVGDGRTDVFRANGSAWLVSNTAGGAWEQINTQPYRLPELAFGNFVGDTRTDVMRADGPFLYVSDGGRGPWEVYAKFWHGSYPLSSFAFADVTGDGKTDLFFSGTP